PWRVYKPGRSAFIHRGDYRGVVIRPTMPVMVELERLLNEQGGVATSGQLLAVLSRRGLQSRLRTGELIKLWPGIYGVGEPDLELRLRGLDLRAGEPIAICLTTAAAAFGFDTEGDSTVHILDTGAHLRGCDGLEVHRRDGAPLITERGRLTTSAPWTAIEVARALPRPRALAHLDAALRSGTCTRQQLALAADAQHGRRGIVTVRDELIGLARPEAESPMESEVRLAMYDAGLPPPQLQFEIVDRSGRMWRLDFAWPDQRVAVEYDGFEWHSSPEALQRDRQKRAALTEMGWRLLSIVSDDVRRRTWEMNRRIGFELGHQAA
ncbi:MAG: hypothetical protein U0R18_18865, partial [Mycobacterium sp.]